MSFPDWVWIYFGFFGTVGAVFFTLVVWYWMKIQDNTVGSLRAAARWNMIGLLFLFLAAWFACGIGGPPGNLLSHDTSIHQLDSAYDSAILSIFLSGPGWISVFLSQRKLMETKR
ncbi:MAG: hypothetical protein ACFFCW_29695 [Candidatus Hodarchaeota archaeon]